MGFDLRIAFRYVGGMDQRSFKQIVEDVGDDVLAERLSLKPHQPRDWRLRHSIPPMHWRALVEQGFATLEELAMAAEMPRPPRREPRARKGASKRRTSTDGRGAAA